jgi:cytidylate kinase
LVGVDTVFLSLGGAAKILCFELAKELDVRMFDFGAMLRALTFSGSPGNLATTLNALTIFLSSAV